MNFNLTILGSSSAVPVFERFPTAQVLQYKDKKYLIDCGEGTQFHFSKYKIKPSGLNQIFISHLHGDHYLGLVGLISTLRLNGRNEDLHIYAPPFLKEILDIQLKFDDREWSFDYIFHPLSFDESEKIYEDVYMEVFTIPLDHKIECNGFLFKEKPKMRRINPEKIKEYKISFEDIHIVKSGGNYTTSSGEVILNEDLTDEAAAPRAYAFCSDTKYNESIIPIIKNVDLLYHESTFMHDLKEIASERFHSTNVEAATIAKLANVKKLAIGHFSGRYKNLQPMLEEAKTVFENTELAVEGTVFEI